MSRRMHVVSLYVLVSLLSLGSWLGPRMPGVRAAAMVGRHDPATRGESAFSRLRSSALLAAYRTRPLAFEINRGQVAGAINAVAHADGYTLFLTAHAAVLVSAPANTRALPAAPLPHAHSPGAPGATDQVFPSKAVSAGTRRAMAIWLRFIGANAHPHVIGLDRLPGVSNYLLGNIPRRWRTSVPSYAQVVYRAVYPGIDLIYHGDRGTLEYDWRLAPHADPGVIRLAIDGVRRVSLDRRGALVLHSAAGDLRQSSPLAYQLVQGRRRLVSARYVLRGSHEIGLALGAYDRGKPLIIDPTLSYSTYLGATYGSAGTAVAVDGSSNVYVTGYTWGPNFPVTTGAYATTASGNYDAFVTKLTSSGTLSYSTYLGGNDDDEAYGIALDASNDVYITGSTAPITTPNTFPTTSNAYQTSYSVGYSDAFISELNSSGTSLLYSSYLGGSAADYGKAIAVDGSNDVYVAGYTGSSNFPTANAYQGSPGGANDAFVAKLNIAAPPASQLVYSTYLGGTGNDYAYGLALGSAGKVYVTGNTPGGFPTVSPLQASYGGGNTDAFVAAIDTTKSGASSLVYSTYLGGSGDDYGQAIAVDTSGNAYMAGKTSSPDFPRSHALQAAYGGGQDDAFVAKLNAAGSALSYSTYLGGSAADNVAALALDSAQDVYLTGYTYSTDFLTSPTPLQAWIHGADDAFVTKLAAPGASGIPTLASSTYLGGSGYDTGTGIAVDSSGTAYVTGATTSTDFPTVNALSGPVGAPAYSDVFVAKVIP